MRVTCQGGEIVLVLVLVLDTTRLSCWELVTVGVRIGGRVVPVGWVILPYPWPKGQFTPTVPGRLERVFACWPSARAVHLVADRGFPSLKLFRLLERSQTRLQLGYTIRLRAGDWVRDATGQAIKIGSLIDTLPAGWVRHPASGVSAGNGHRTTGDPGPRSRHADDPRASAWTG